jgi:predicted DNA-binding helix-hairpin-helix protein
MCRAWTGMQASARGHARAAPGAVPARRAAQRAAVPRFAPGGQSTQMIVGADRATDADILESSHTLYAGYGLRRVYYSASAPFPMPRATCRRRHRPHARAPALPGRLAHALLRLATGRARSRRPAATACWTWRSTLSKLAWALANRQQFPRGPASTVLRAVLAARAGPGHADGGAPAGGAPRAPAAAGRPAAAARPRAKGPAPC